MSPGWLELGRQIVDAGLDRGAQNVEFRHQLVRTREVETHNCRTSALENRLDCGLAVRVLCGGSWGVAATTELSPGDTFDALDRALTMAVASQQVQQRPIELAPEPGHGHLEWESPCKTNPIAVNVDEVVELLNQWSSRLLGSTGVDDVHARLAMLNEESVTVTSSGTSAVQNYTRIHPLVHVTGLHPQTREPTVARSLAPPTARGWEYVEGDGWDWDAEWTRLPADLAEAVVAPEVHPGTYDLVIAPSNLWLTLHETVGHATELDRMLGYEQGYAGTSFVAPQDLGSLPYGSAQMTVVADRVRPHGLATMACDAEGVLTQEWPLVREGRLVGAQSDRASAGAAGLARSTGCSYAESPLRTPLARMANVSLLPTPSGPSLEELIASVERGLLVVGSNSWSIDMDRRDFQFTAQHWYRIEAGRIAGQVRHAAYRGQTQSFWNSLEAVGGPQSFQVYGADLCGKGQPPQASGASHGAPATLFGGVEVLNTRG